MASKNTVVSLVFLLALLFSCIAMSGAARILDEEEATPPKQEESPAAPHLTVPELPKFELPPFPEVHMPTKPELPKVELPPKPEMPSFFPEFHFPAPEAKP